MPKVFYTERDIENLFKQGVTTLKVDENMVLTGLAYEKARKLGLTLEQSQPDAYPDAPIRPYLSQKGKPAAPKAPAAEIKPQAAEAKPQAESRPDVAARIRSAVNAQMGGQIDPNLLETIIQRVVKATGVK
jgi:hypothetical protein